LIFVFENARGNAELVMFCARKKAQL